MLDQKRLFKARQASEIRRYGKKDEAKEQYTNDGNTTQGTTTADATASARRLLPYNAAVAVYHHYHQYHHHDKHYHHHHRHCHHLQRRAGANHVYAACDDTSASIWQLLPKENRGLVVVK